MFCHNPLIKGLSLQQTLFGQTKTGKKNKNYDKKKDGKEKKHE